LAIVFCPGPLYRDHRCVSLVLADRLVAAQKPAIGYTPRDGPGDLLGYTGCASAIGVYGLPGPSAQLPGL